MAKKEPIVLYKKDMDKLHKKGNVVIDDVLLVYQIDPELPTKKDTEEDTEEEIDELVDYDGSIIGSKIPLGWENVKTMSATKTMDATVPMGRQSGMDPSRSNALKRYWGESVEEIGEHDMTDVLGYDDTIYMDANETIEYFKKEHDMEEDEAEDRTESMGKTTDLDKKSDDGESFQRLVEDGDVLNMLEIILNKKDDESGVQDFNTEDSMLDRKVRHLKKYARNKGYSMGELINLMDNE
tara:strand:+ start:588 stop:1304 length:717 start_codon:yes stop_codon:yes gene_type:complete